MVEIAIALAIIGFALVAIIGVLPMGLDVQKNNRRETIVNQDANYFIEAIRNGARSLDDLTNYVAAITISANGAKPDGYLNPNPIFWSSFPNTPSFPLPQSSSYNLNNQLPLTSGERIIGLLSTPKYVGNVTNYIVAYVKAISGAAIEKAPQDNATVNEAAFSYRLVPEIVPYTSLATNWNNGSARGQIIAAGGNNAWLVANNLHANLCDLRLLFRWPLLPGWDSGLPKVGNGRQVYRLMVNSSQSQVFTNGTDLYFFQPQLLTNAP